MRHTVTSRLAALLGMTIAWLAVGQTLAGAPEKSRIEDEDIWAYKQFIRSYEATNTLRKQGWPAPDVASALSSGREMTIILLDRSTSAASAKALAYMGLLKVDGAVAEDHSCAVLRKGKTIIPYLEQAKVKHGHCVTEVNIKPICICADPEEALRRIEN
jgi:hypothetical protein